MLDTQYDRQTLINSHEARRDEVAALVNMSAEDVLRNGPITRKMVTGGSKHWSDKRIDELNKVESLLELKVGVNKGVFIPLQVITVPYRTVSVQFIVVDVKGHVGPVHLFRLPRQQDRPYEYLVPLHGIFLLREPYIRLTSDGFLLRVESPTDIIWSPSFDYFNHTPTSIHHYFQVLKGQFQEPQETITPEEWKIRGNALYTKHHHFAALAAYTRGISKAEGHIQSLLRLNRIAVLLSLSYPGAALRDSDQIDASHLDQNQLSKLTLRKASALYLVGAFEACLDMEKSLTGTAQGLELLSNVKERLEETKGNFSWFKMYRNVSCHHSVATFIGPIALHTGESFGRGLFASRHIKPGEVLLVSPPLGVVSPKQDERELVFGLNQDSGSTDSHAQVELTARIIDKMRDWEITRWMVMQLHPGNKKGKYRQSEQFSLENVQKQTLADFRQSIDITSIDTSFVESAITYNVFRPESITEPRNPDNAVTNSYAPAALYFYPSMMNSACLGNAIYSFVGDVWVLRSSIEIAEGQQIMDTYVDPTQSYEEREKVSERHGYKCDCLLCQWDREDGAENRQKRSNYMSQVSRGMTIPLLLQIRQQVVSTYSPSQTTRTIYPDVYTVDRVLAHVYEENQAFKEAGVALEDCLHNLGLPIRERHTLRSDYIWTARIRIVDVIVVALELGRIYEVLKDKESYLFYVNLAKTIDAHAFGPGLPLSRHAL